MRNVFYTLIESLFIQGVGMREKNIFSFFSLLILCLFIMAGCNQTFEPLKENDKYFFTIFGYLDASALADTQWVRIQPPRQQIDAPANVPDMTVTLENVETGNLVVMKDSLFGGESGFNYINFYSTADIEPGQKYQIKAEHPDGRTSSVSLTTPEEFPTPLFLLDSSRTAEEHHHSVVIPGLENQKLVDVQTWYFVRNNKTNKIRKFTFSHIYTVEWVDSYYGGAYVVDIIPEREEGRIFSTLNISSFFGSNYDLLRRQIFVAVAGPEWSEEIHDMSDLVYAQMEGFSNVENGLGYMIGIYSKIIPYYPCEKEDKSDSAPCDVEKPYR